MEILDSVSWGSISLEKFSICFFQEYQIATQLRPPDVNFLSFSRISQRECKFKSPHLCKDCANAVTFHRILLFHLDSNMRQNFLYYLPLSSCGFSPLVPLLTQGVAFWESQIYAGCFSLNSLLMGLKAWILSFTLLDNKKPLGYPDR